MDKRENTASHVLARFRGFIQAAATLITNIHLPNFAKGGIYQGAGKTVCVPGLNCYSCPAASGACPIGSFQSVIGSSKFNFSYYVTGTLILLGVLLGRFVCGFLCPFGWLQELLHKIPSKKFSTKRLKALTYIKYVVLLFAVVLLPVLVVNDLGMGDPFFCKYICPQGVLEGAIPLAAANAGIRSALGHLFTWKLAVLIAVVVLSVLFYRPFCKWICPLGARCPCWGFRSTRANASRAASVQGFVRWTLMWSARPIMPNVSGAESASGPAPSMPSAIAMAWMCRRKSFP